MSPAFCNTLNVRFVEIEDFIFIIFLLKQNAGGVKQGVNNYFFLFDLRMEEVNRKFQEKSDKILVLFITFLVVGFLATGVRWLLETGNTGLIVIRRITFDWNDLLGMRNCRIL